MPISARDGDSSHKCNLSTQYQTELTVKPLESTFTSKTERFNEDEKEENYWDWHAKQVSYLKLPVFYPPPRRGKSAKSRKTMASS
jgi:hypothetical protein